MAENPPAKTEEFDWDALAPAEAAPVKVSTVQPFDAMTLPAAIRNRVEESLIEFVKGFADYKAKGNKPENYRADWKVQPFPTLEMANKFIALAKKYARNRPTHIPLLSEAGEPVVVDGSSVMKEHTNDGATPAGQITLRVGKPGPVTDPADKSKTIHEIAVRYLAKPLEKNEGNRLPGSAK